MATEPRSDPTEAEPERTVRPPGFERHPPKPGEAKEGIPGYGQPDEEVREQKLPEQDW
ncbi:hypothetical protein JGU66_26120 [Myxococcaceae bacterium JPH2]|nr:hypothetical protein [Myxococcaceae bacterium JPH2]